MTTVPIPCPRWDMQHASDRRMRFISEPADPAEYVEVTRPQLPGLLIRPWHPIRTNLFCSKGTMFGHRPGYESSEA